MPFAGVGRDAVAARLERDERAVIGAARDALLELLAVEAVPVSFHLRLCRGHDPGPGTRRLGSDRRRPRPVRARGRYRSTIHSSVQAGRGGAWPESRSAVHSSSVSRSSSGAVNS